MKCTRESPLCILCISLYFIYFNELVLYYSRVLGSAPSLVSLLYNFISSRFELLITVSTLHTKTLYNGITYRN